MPDVPIYYWAKSNASAEIDFVVQHSGNVVQIEVKAEVNLQAKSLSLLLILGQLSGT